jgi:hypothetical protein
MPIGLPMIKNPSNMHVAIFAIRKEILELICELGTMYNIAMACIFWTEGEDGA